MRGGKKNLSLQSGRRLKPLRLIQVVNGPLSADTPLRPKPSLIFGEGMSWLLQLSQAQLFTFPLSEQSCLRPAAWWRVCVSVSKRKQARILTRCTSNTAYSKIQQYKQLYTSKLGAASKTAASLHNAQLWSKLFYSRFHRDFLWSDRHMLTVDETVDEFCAVAFVSVREAQENLKKKCCWCMHCSMIDASPLWPGQAFTLSQHSSHHDCVPLEV